MPNDTQNKIERLQADLDALRSEFYRNNFNSSQDFNKYVSFNGKLKVPVLTATPTTCDIGEVCCVSGKLRVCSAANTWTIVGTQV